MKFLATIAFAIGGGFLMALSPDAALADKRVALVIGNSAYQNAPKLANPANDASAIAAMFRQAGFDVLEFEDLGNLEFKRAVRNFEDANFDADIGVVFYAGHGIEIGGVNYMIPVDAKLASDRDAMDEAITLDRIVESVDSAKRLRLVIVDACRDNPFVATMKRMRPALRSVSAGLGAIQPTGTDTLIAYAAKAGSTADDGFGEHSPFTTALLHNLPIPGLDIRLAFGRVRDEVMKMTHNKQEPFVYGSIGGDTISIVPAPAQPKQPNLADMKADYDLVEKIGTRKAWEVFLGTYKTGFYADIAREQLNKLGPAPSPAPSLEAPVPEDVAAWNRIKDSSDQDSLKNFIKRYASSPLVPDAQHRLEILQQAEQERRAAKDWDAIKNSNDQTVLTDFINRYPSSPLVSAARSRLDGIQKAEQDRQLAQAAWEKIKNTNDQAILQDFAGRFPSSPLASLAQARLQAIQKAEQDRQLAQAAWEKIKNTNDQAILQDFAGRFPSSPLASLAQARLQAVQQAEQDRQMAEAAWSRIKDTNDQAALKDFVNRYPSSPLVSAVQARLTALQQAEEDRQMAQATWAKIIGTDDQAAGSGNQSRAVTVAPPIKDPRSTAADATTKITNRALDAGSGNQPPAVTVAPPIKDPRSIDIWFWWWPQWR
jgi:outer membrane protein assembly factor BamD (BamD/ComL family)